MRWHPDQLGKRQVYLRFFHALIGRAGPAAVPSFIAESCRQCLSSILRAFSRDATSETEIEACLFEFLLLLNVYATGAGADEIVTSVIQALEVRSEIYHLFIRAADRALVVVDPKVRLVERCIECMFEFTGCDWVSIAGLVTMNNTDFNYNDQLSSCLRNRAYLILYAHMIRRLNTPGCSADDVANIAFTIRGWLQVFSVNNGRDSQKIALFLPLVLSLYANQIQAESQQLNIMNGIVTVIELSSRLMEDPELSRWFFVARLFKDKSPHPVQLRLFMRITNIILATFMTTTGRPYTRKNLRALLTKQSKDSLHDFGSLLESVSYQPFVAQINETKSFIEDLSRSFEDVPGYLYYIMLQLFSSTPYLARALRMD